MADRVDFYFRQRVTEAELDLAFALLEKADRDLAADLNIYGIVAGAVPAPHSPVPDLTVDLTAPQKYSLNSPTLDAIDHLAAQGYRVRLVGFFSNETLREQEAADILLRQYVAEGDGAIQVRYVDPNKEPDIARRFGYQSGYDGDLFLEIAEDAQAVVGHAGGQFVGVVHADDGRRAAGRPVADVVLLDDRDLDAAPRQLQGGGAAIDAAADDDHVICISHW